MKKFRIKFYIFIAAATLGFLFMNSVNLTDIDIKTANLTAVEYKKAVDSRGALTKEVDELKHQNEEMKRKINKYNNTVNKDLDVLNDMKVISEQYGMINGSTDVRGPGVVMKISDGDFDTNVDTQYDIWNKIFHDNDAAQIFNEIRLSGAETFSVNSHRIIPSSGVVCKWAFLGFDDGRNEAGPFTFYIIGDPDVIYASLTDENSYITKLKNRQLKIQIEKSDNIVIPATTQNLEPNFMKRSDS